MFQREWCQMKIRDNHFPDAGSGKGQDQVPGFSGSLVHLSKARKQSTCTVLPNGWNSTLHLFCVHLRRTTEILPFSGPAGEENNALNQANTNLLFPQCNRAHSCGFAARLHGSCSRLSRVLPCLRAGPDSEKPLRARLT